MAKLDLVLFILFGAMALIGSVTAVVCFRMALKVAGARDGDVKMFFWALASMLGLIVAGMSLAYILLPIIIHRT
jgi:hypothetical protein